MSANFIPPIPIGQFKPSSEAIASWLYEIWRYLQNTPIPTSADVSQQATQTAQNYVTVNVPPMVASAIAALDYHDFVDGTSLPIYRASNDEIGQQDLLEAWNEGCRFALVDDDSFFIMIKNDDYITLLQVLTQAQATNVVSVNGQSGVVVITSSDLQNESSVSGATITAALNTINSDLQKEIVTINIASYSGSQIRVPATGTNSAITADHVVLSSVIGTPANQSADWTVTTYAGYLTLSGAAAGATTVKLVLGKAGTTI